MSSKIAMNTKTKMFLTGGFWVKLIIVVAAGIVFMQKDINFQINFQSPLNNQNTQDEQPKEEGEKTKSDKELSDNQSGGSGLEGLATSLFGVKKKSKKARMVSNKNQPRLEDATGEQVRAFVTRFSNVAVSEMHKFDIPASIILANGLLQSAAGQSDYTKSANNYFNIKCDASWDGGMKDFDGVCFRKYESAWAGFRGHSLYINENFGSLKKYGAKDYDSWAKELEKGGYGKQKGLAKKLVRIIEKYDLDQFDKK